MSYQFRRDQSVRTNVRRIVAEQVRRAVTAIDAAAIDRVEGVHEFRKCCKKLRAVAQLAGPALGPDRKRIDRAARDAARVLARSRDTSVLRDWVNRMRQTCDAEQRPVWTKLSSALQSCAGPESITPQDYSRASSLLLGLQKRRLAWHAKANAFSPIREGLESTYARSRRLMSRALKDFDSESLHEWRKFAKYHWYHVRLLQPVWPEMMGCQAAQLEALTEGLGSLHDLWLLERWLSSQAEVDDSEPLQDCIEAIPAQLRAQTRRLGRRLFAESPKALGKRLQRYWRIWRSEKH